LENLEILQQNRSNTSEKHAVKELQTTANTGRCTHPAGSDDDKVQNLQHAK
jgi:hypothetical protein